MIQPVLPLARVALLIGGLTDRGVPIGTQAGHRLTDPACLPRQGDPRETASGCALQGEPEGLSGGPAHLRL